MGHGGRGFGAAQSQSRPDAAGDRSKGAQPDQRHRHSIERRLDKIGGQIRLIGQEYEALGNQRFAPKQGTGPDLQNVKGDEKSAGTDQAGEDWADVRAGTATPEQVGRLRAAATLTPEQTAAVQQGKPATIDQGQYDYLNGLMRAQDGMSAAEINKTLDKYPTWRARWATRTGSWVIPTSRPPMASMAESATSRTGFRPC